MEGTPAWRDRVLARIDEPATSAAATRAITVAERVVDSANQLLLERGGPTFTVPELAKRAQTSLATLYSYFSGKDEVLLAVIEAVADVTLREPDAELEALTDPLARLRRVVRRPILLTAESGGRASLIYFREAWRLTELYPNELQVLTEPATTVVQQELDAAVAAGVVASDDTYRDALNIRLFVWSLIQAMQVSSAEDAEAVADNAWTFCSRALSIRESANV